MGITLDQARAFEAVADCGSFARASQRLNKAHSAIVYAVKAIESELGLKLLDRTQYRSTLTPQGRRVLDQCRRLLGAEKDLEMLCGDLTAGWEPHVRVIYEGVLPFDPIVKTLSSLSERRMPTRFEIFSEFHRDVESAFIEREAQFMISVIPPQKAALESIKLTPLRMFLVAEAKHPLVKGRKARTLEDLKFYPFLTVKGSDPRLNLSTGIIDELSSFHMCDFNSKKFAILGGVGFGWMPECLIERELRLKKLKLVRWQKANTHTLQPYLYHRGERHMGKAARAFLHEFMSYESKPLCERCIENPRRENCCS